MAKNLSEVFLNFPDEGNKIEIVNDLGVDDETEEVDAETDEQETEKEGSAPDDETSDDNEDTSDDGTIDFEADAVKQYQERMAAIGARFDADGRMTFDAPQIAPVDEFADPNEAFRVELTRNVAPMVVNAAISDVTSRLPVMKQYANDVRAILKGLDPAGINPQVVESYFFYVRGQRADVEIAAKLKERGLKTKDRQIKSDAAAKASEPSGRRVSKPKTDAKVDPATEFFAKSLKQNPQELANAVVSARGGR